MNMKHSLLCGLGLSALLFTLGSASAADMPVKAEPVYNWTGFYVGGTVGAAFGAFDVTTTTPAGGTYYTFPLFVGALADPAAVLAAAGAQSLSSIAPTFGLEAGYNWQAPASPWVFGVEADFESMHLSSASNSGSVAYPLVAALAGGTPGTFSLNSAAHTDWLFTARPRIGWTPYNSILLYVTGGLALTQTNASFAYTDTLVATALGAPLGISTESAAIRNTRVGDTVGGGIEVAFGDHLSAKLEYLFVDFSKASVTSTNLVAPVFGAFPGQPFTHSVDLLANIARVGINYKFDPRY
jgi:outer membrane immunogenic protein